MLKTKKKPKGKKGEAAEAEADAEGAPEAAPAGDGEALTLDGEGHETKKKPPMMIIIGAAVAAVLVLGGGGTAAFLMLKKPAASAPAKPGEAAKDAKDAKAKDAKKKEKPKDEKKEGGDAKKGPDPNAPVIKDGPEGVVFYTLPDVVVNMQTADGRPSFLKLKLTLELPDHDTADVLTPNMPRLQDMFQVFLRELRPEDLSGSQGGYALRMEILRRVNLVIAPSKANAVLIEEMLVN
jgi:flagellar FliL protein